MELLAQKPDVRAVSPDCHNITDLVDVAQGQAQPEVVLRVNQHAEQCAECRERLVFYRGVLNEEDDEEVPVAGSLLERLAQHVAKMKRETPMIDPTQLLGRLERVDLREAWPTEDGHFTPWLAHPENIALLGEVIGLDLEVEDREKSVGIFRADILCKDSASDSWVLVENQLERTDHSHLGQLLTYAAGLQAVTIVWVAKEFTDEHRAALDWLNQITDGRFNFFGLEIELCRIAGSPAAPRFNVVCKPNDWTQKVHETVDRELTDTQRLQLEFWTAFHKLLQERGSKIRGTKPLPQHWNNFSIGRAKCRLATNINTRARRIGVYLVLKGPHAYSRFDRLRADSKAIEEEVGAHLEWLGEAGRRQGRINLNRNDTDPTDRARWPEQQEWLRENLELFYRVFAPRVEELAVPEDDASEDGSAA
jgi:hypothetical protein